METPKKSNAGRHKKDCECPKCQAKKGLFVENEPVQEPETFEPKQPEIRFIDSISDNQTFDNRVPDLLADYEIVETPVQMQPIETSEQHDPVTPQVITGHLLLILVDTIMPLGISWGANKFFGKNIKAREIKMTPDERESLIELAEATASQLNVNVPPLQLFLISCSLIYASKVM